MRTDADRFAEVLRAGLMGPRLAAVLGGPATCHVLDAKLEPEVRATVLYDLAGRLVRGDLLDRTRPADHDGAGTVVEPHLRVRVFPDDPDLPGLPRMTDPACLAPALAGLHRTPGRPRPGRCRIRLLRYRPGKRATAAVLVPPVLPALVVKVYHSGDKAAAVAREATALYALPERTGVLRFAPPAGLVPDWHVVAQEAVRGTALDALLAGRGAPGDSAVAGVRLAGRALAELHELPAVTERQRPVVAELHRFGTRAAGLAPLDPLFAADAQRLADRLLALHELLPPTVRVPVHGDCKPSQFLLFEDRVHLLDLDHHGLGDPATDVGTFLATLRQLAVRRVMVRRGSLADVAPLERAFLDAYLTACGGDPDAVVGRIRWQLSVALARKSLRAFARAPHSPLPHALVQQGNACLDESGREGLP